jgi:hypothetical protein
MRRMPLITKTPGGNMRKLIIALSTGMLLSLSPLSFAADAQQMDESTNPNTNRDVKTQNMQQKPNAAHPENERRSTTRGDRKSNVDPAADESTPESTNRLPPGTNTEKLRQKPNP